MSQDTKSWIKCHIQSLIGGRSENQDSAGIADTAIGTVVIVCDGMGAVNGGSVASSLAVKTILEEFSDVDENSSPAEVLRNAVNKANDAILDAAEENPSLSGMGTTLTVAVINDNCATVTHLGDSRIYQLRGHKKIFRTFDHSFVFGSVALGIITEEQARLSSQSNIITQALGIRREIELEIHELPYLSGDRFVLCTDGFWGAMPEPQFIKMIARGNVSKTLDEAATYVDRIGIVHGGHHDNLTAALFDVKKESKKKVKMSKKVKIFVAVLALLVLSSMGLNVYQWHKYNSTQETQSLKTKVEINKGLDEKVNNSGEEETVNKTDTTALGTKAGAVDDQQATPIDDKNNKKS